jgi:TonB family protein
VLITDGKVEYSQSRPDIDDASVPVEVQVAADGKVTNAVVSETSGNLEADALAVAFMRDRKFLPGLNAKGETSPSVVKVIVNMYKRGNRKVARVVVKPPPVAQEKLRLKTLMCADFIWEIDRMDKEAGMHDLSLEVMPYTSARMYMEQKHVPDKLETKFWDEWPDALRKVVDRCEKDQTRLFYSEVLVPTLDGIMPPDTATASN